MASLQFFDVADFGSPTQDAFPFTLTQVHKLCCLSPKVECTEYSMHSNCEELLVHNQNMPGAGNAVRQVAQLELLVMVACCCQVESVN